MYYGSKWVRVIYTVELYVRSRWLFPYRRLVQGTGLRLLYSVLKRRHSTLALRFLSLDGHLLQYVSNTLLFDCWGTVHAV